MGAEQTKGAGGSLGLLKRRKQGKLGFSERTGCPLLEGEGLGKPV